MVSESGDTIFVLVPAVMLLSQCRMSTKHWVPWKD
jgi:hypothetical protein